MVLLLQLLVNKCPNKVNHPEKLCVKFSDVEPDSVYTLLYSDSFPFHGNTKETKYTIPVFQIGHHKYKKTESQTRNMPLQTQNTPNAAREAI